MIVIIRHTHTKYHSVPSQHGGDSTSRNKDRLKTEDRLRGRGLVCVTAGGRLILAPPHSPSHLRWGQTHLSQGTCSVKNSPAAVQIIALDCSIAHHMTKEIKMLFSVEQDEIFYCFDSLIEKLMKTQIGLTLLKVGFSLLVSVSVCL